MDGPPVARTDPDCATAQAEEALRLVFEDPRRARDAGLLARRRARRDRDGTAEAMAERALGLAARELGELRAAARHLRTAVGIATACESPALAAEAEMSLAMVCALQGDTAEAMRLGAAAGRVLRGVAAARLQMQLALIAQRLGRFDDALAGYEQALTVFRREGDRFWEAKLLNNRGVMAVYRGRPQAADADLQRAEALYAGLSQQMAVADVGWNRGFAAGRSGAVAVALRHFAVAEAHYVECGQPRAMLLLDQCEVLLMAGLSEEARDKAAAAVTELSRRRMAADLAEARLILAQAALACGDLDCARNAAHQASRAFDRQGRAAWAAVARYVLVRIAWTRGRCRADVLRTALASGTELMAAGWTVAALDAELIAARLAIRLGDLDQATASLRRISGFRRHGLPAQRVGGWHATALLRLAAGDTRGAEAALRAGLRSLDRHRLMLGATELRVLAAVHGAELISTGLSLAVASRRPARVLDWAERGRARSLQQRPLRPPPDPEMAEHIAALRVVSNELEQALADKRETGPLSRRQAALERTIRDSWRRIDGGQVPQPQAAATPSALADQLGDRALIEYLSIDGELHAVVVTAGRTSLHRLGPEATAAYELRQLRFGLRRRASGYAGPGSAAAASLEHSARILDELLVHPLRRIVGERDLVIVPTGGLHGLPWSLLRSCRGRPVTVAPSAHTWLCAERAAAENADDEPAPRTVLVAGPGLPGAEAEVSALAAGYDRAVCLTGAQAGVAAVLVALEGARCAHLAAHGRFRNDNPQFSALTLADGPLTVSDLEGLRRPPRLVVLSACDSGVSAVHSGDELMGFAAALLGIGTRSLIATMVPVLDTTAEPLMTAMHAELRAGRRPAAALAAVQNAAASNTEAAAFVCFGAG